MVGESLMRIAGEFKTVKLYTILYVYVHQVYILYIYYSICYMAYRTLDPRYTLPYIPIRVLHHTKLQTLFTISH